MPDEAEGQPPRFPDDSVRCPNCQHVFLATRQEVDGELRCPACGNKGFVAPGNAPQMSDAQVEGLTEEQFEAYLRHGFEVVDPLKAPPPAWGAGPPIRSRVALASSWLASPRCPGGLGVAASAGFG